MKEYLFKEVSEEWRDYLETGKDKIDKEKFEIEEYDFSDLLKCYEEWKKEDADKIVQDSYQIATELLKKYEIPYLSEDDINEFMGEVEDKEHLYNGVFSSAMINELYKDDEIHIYLSDIGFLGCYNKNKKVVVEGDCRYGTGAYMKNGKIIVKGDCGDNIGFDIQGGKIKIYGDNFNPKEQISAFAKKGEIYYGDELVWENGKFMGDLI